MYKRQDADRYIEFLESHDQLENSQILNETKLALYKHLVTEKFNETDQFPDMGPIKKQPFKQLSPSADSHDSNFPSVNYESKSQKVDEHTENQFSTFNMSSMHWTDMLEIALIIAAGLLFLKHVRKYLRNRKKKEQAKRQADLVSQIQGTIPLSPLPINPAYASPPAPMLEDKTGGNNRGPRSCVQDL